MSEKPLGRKLRRGSMSSRTWNGEWTTPMGFSFIPMKIGPGEPALSPFPAKYSSACSLPRPSKVLFEGVTEFPAPIVQRIQLAQEEPQHGWFSEELQPLDQLPVAIEPLESVDDVFDMRYRIDSPGQGNPGELQIRVDFLAVFVAVRRNRAPFHRSHAGSDIERGRQSPGDIVLLGNVSDKLPGINVAGQPPRGGDHWNPHPVEFLDEILDLFDGTAGDRGVDHLAQPHGHGPDLSHRPPAVGVEPFADGQPG